MISLVLRHLVESTLFCVALGMLAQSLRRQGAAARHTIWLIGISKFCIPTVLLSITGARIAFILPAASWAGLLGAKLSALFRIFPSRLELSAVSAPSVVFLSVWSLGTAALFIIWWIRFRQSRRNLSVPTIEELTALYKAKRLLGGNRTEIGLRRSGIATEPSLLGILRPIVTIPIGLSGQLTPSEFEAVLVHELAHARRRDNLAAAFLHFVACIFWFHPLLWILERFLVTERERACDELVLRSGTVPQVYVAGILKVCRFHLFEHQLRTDPAASYMTRSDLKNRLDRILGCRSYRPVPSTCRLLIAALAILMAFLPMAGGYCQQCLSNGEGLTHRSAPCAPASASKTAVHDPGRSCGS